MKRVHAVILAIFVPTILAGCADKRPLSNSAIASILRADRAAHCDQQTIYIRSGRFGQGNAARAEAWFDNSLLTDDRFHHRMETTDITGTHGELSYRDGEDRFHVLWAQFDRPSDIEGNQLSITACVYVPKTIEVINSSFQGDTARVLFTEHLQLSLLGERLKDAGLLKLYDPIDPPGGYEYTALLGQTARAWRVMGIGLR